MSGSSWLRCSAASACQVQTSPAAYRQRPEKIAIMIVSSYQPCRLAGSRFWMSLSFWIRSTRPLASADRPGRGAARQRAGRAAGETGQDRPSRDHAAASAVVWVETNGKWQRTCRPPASSARGGGA